jgi:hypothetical protein
VLSPYTLIAFLSISVGGGTYATSSRQPVPVTNLSVVSVPGSRAVYLGSPLIPHIMSLPVPITAACGYGAVPAFTHHVSGWTPSGCLLLQTTLRGVVCLNANRFSSGQSPEFTGLLSGNSSAATLTGLATEGPANIA